MAKASVLIAISGGVDSSVCAGLLKQQGYDCRAAFMRLHEASDPADAQRIADQLEIPLEILDCRQDLQQVVDYFLDEYRHARTPNPCIQCNRWLKFGKLFDHGRSIGCDYFATGHYARITQVEDRSRVGRGVDPDKDQSYALFQIPPDRLSRILLPLGDYHKSQIRQLARDMDLPVHDKAESQEICFVPNDDYIAFLLARAPELTQPGKVVNTAGDVLGEHEGIFRYTIGQRRGLGIALGEPAYVVRLDAETNTIVLGAKNDLLQSRLTAKNTTWHVLPSESPFKAHVQIRYNHKAVPATVTPIASNDKDCSRFQVDFQSPVPAVTPGQAAVCYDSHAAIITGGWIE